MDEASIITYVRERYPDADVLIAELVLLVRPGEALAELRDARHERRVRRGLDLDRTASPAAKHPRVMYLRPCHVPGAAEPLAVGRSDAHGARNTSVVRLSAGSLHRGIDTAH